LGLPGRGLCSLPLVSAWTSWAERFTERLLDPVPLVLRGGQERSPPVTRSSDE